MTRTVNSITCGERPQMSDQCTDESYGDVGLSASDFPDEDSSELDVLFDLICDSISNLLTLSIQIYTAARTGQFAKSAKLPTLPADPYIRHVKEKHPKLPAQIAEKLGEANARRRQHFIYRRDHHEKLATGLDEAEAGRSQTDVTEATKLVGMAALDTFESPEEEERQSVTTFCTEASGAESDVPRVPSMPRSSMNQQPFECPLCYNIISVKGRSDWK